MAKKYIEKYTIDYFKKYVSEQKETILESTFISDEIDMYDIQINKAKQQLDGNKVKYFEHCKVIASEYLKEFIAPEPSKQAESKKIKIYLTAPAKDIFCKILIAKNIEQINEKNIMVTCSRICEKYGIELQSKLGKTYFNTHKKDKLNRYYEQIKETLLPKINDPKIIETVHEYIKSN